MPQRIISRVIGNLVERPAVEVPHLQKILQIVIFRIVFFYLNQ